MPYPHPEKPVPGAAAFAEDSAEAAMSRAALLLAINRQLEGPSLRAAGELGSIDGFPVPAVTATGQRFRLGPPPTPPESMALRDAAIVERADLADELFRRPSAETAARLANACLADPDELTRVAAAPLHFSLSVDPRPSIAILAAGTRSREEVVREVAATALARIAPRHQALNRLRRGRPSPEGLGEARTTMLIHGTWARASEWWQPGGTFHSFLLAWRPDLYGAPDRFEWTGGYSPGARAAAAGQLVDWIEQHGEDGLSLITHSHGGNVAFLASWGGPRIGDLIVLSCPVWPEYVPDFPQVGRLVSVRVKCDLVILADGGGQRFQDPRVTEIVLPVWFNHSATHTPGVWTSHDVAAKIDAA